MKCQQGQLSSFVIDECPLMESDRSLPCSLGCSDLPTSPSGWSTGHVVLCATSVNILYRVTVEMNSLSSKRVNRCGPKSQDTYGYRFTSGSYVNSCSVAQEMECDHVLFFSLSCVTFSFSFFALRSLN